MFALMSQRPIRYPLRPSQCLEFQKFTLVTLLPLKGHPARVWAESVMIWQALLDLHRWMTGLFYVGNSFISNWQPLQTIS